MTIDNRLRRQFGQLAIAAVPASFVLRDRALGAQADQLTYQLG